VQGVRVAELEADNAKLLAGLEQIHQALTEAGSARKSLSMSHAELEKDCTGLHPLSTLLWRKRLRS
jgi:hypothetical protein